MKTLEQKLDEYIQRKINSDILMSFEDEIKFTKGVDLLKPLLLEAMACLTTIEQREVYSIACDCDDCAKETLEKINSIIEENQND